MDVGDTLKELNMTVDEMDKFTKAFKDDKFREMLRDYAQEISDPENRKRYEEEIKLLEQERGNSIEFIHPQPFRAFKTSVDGKQKCFINICASEKVGKPESKCVVSEDGRRGQRWSLPHSLPPGRPDTDHKGNKIMIYDVVFHPDTLHIASKNKRFMDMVEGTAIQGIQDAFKVTLDKNNVKEMRTKYKGTPQPCVIRKPIPGYKAKEQSEQPDLLAFPYPDEKRPATLTQAKTTELPPMKNSSAEPKSFQIQPQKTKESTKPKYTVKYRSVIDLQDFRYSRDSAQSPRPKEIVVTIDMPLLKSVGDTSLEVKEKTLLLESKTPAYRLELPLAYSVDEDKGEAKFNKQRGQLTVTLPVLPPKVDFDYLAGPAMTDGDFQSVSDDESQKDSEVEGDKKEQEKHCVEKGQEEKQIQEQGTMVEEAEEEEEKGQEKGEEQMREDGKNEEGEETGAEEETWKELERKSLESVEEEKGVEVQKSGEQEQINKEIERLTRQDKQNEDIELSKCDKLREHGCNTSTEKRKSDLRGFQCDIGISDEEENSVAADSRDVASSETEKQHISISAGHSCGMKERGEGNLTSSLDSAPKIKTSDIQEESEKTKETVQGNMQVGTDEESKTLIVASLAPPMTTTISQNNVEDSCISVKSSKIPEADEATKSSRGDTGKQFTLCSEEVAAHSVKQQDVKEEIDIDDLPTEQIFQTSEHDKKPPAVLLGEIDTDGNETVISDHSTSTGFIFQNTLLYELD
ncbi:protein kintoun-like [Amphiprion ocellaris]|uniref:Protein kintoun n=1 Tax=Amphiprion ocellaris TaxID=80972 RepID=A0A3Q1AYI6_AMPOC|nr:protein kintoun [Amphiprion ocellaris]XP_054862226.1 protein kintoun-like [Amphiprion ocellaris]